MENLMIDINVLRTLIEKNTKVYNVTIKTVYWDYGANMTHETIIITEKSGDSSYQLLTISESDSLKHGIMTMAKAMEIITKLKKRYIFL